MGYITHIYRRYSRRKGIKYIREWLQIKIRNSGHQRGNEYMLLSSVEREREIDTGRKINISVTETVKKDVIN